MEIVAPHIILFAGVLRTFPEACAHVSLCPLSCQYSFVKYEIAICSKSAAKRRKVLHEEPIGRRKVEGGPGVKFSVFSFQLGRYAGCIENVFVNYRSRRRVFESGCIWLHLAASAVFLSEKSG